MRADATRNRARILEAARELVREHGADLAMDDLARRAGVAVGTLYRHFPSKGSLVTAVVEDSVAEVEHDTRAALDRATGAPGTAREELFGLFSAIAERHANDRSTKAAAIALHSPGDDAGAGTAERGWAAAVTRAVDLVAELLALAQAEGGVRGDVSVEDIGALLSGVPDSAPSREVYVSVVLSGLRAPAPPQDR